MLKKKLLSCFCFLSMMFLAGEYFAQVPPSSPFRRNSQGYYSGETRPQSTFPLQSEFAESSPESPQQQVPSQILPSNSGRYYNASVILDSVFYNLPYSDVPDGELSPRECRNVISELKIRLRHYQTAQKSIEDRIAALGGDLPRKSSDQRDKLDSSDAKNSKEDSRTNKKEMHVASSDGTQIDGARGVLVATSSEGGAATGFIGKIKGKLFIITNLHVMCGGGNITFKTVDGELVHTPESGFVASEQDIYIIPINDIPMNAIALPLDEAVSSNVKIDDDVIVCGNGEGGGVLLRTLGKVLALGPSTIETDCAIFKGNSGSPIYHKDSGKVIGIISHAKVKRDNDALANTSRRRYNSAIQSNTRYFGQRIDTVKTWFPLSPSDIANQAAEVRIFARKFYQMQTFRNSNTIPGGFDYPAFDKIAMEYLRSKNGAAKKATREFLDASAKLVNHELSMIKSRKISEVFQDEINEISSQMIKLRDDYISMAKSPSLQ